MKCDARYLLSLSTALIVACGGGSDDSPVPLGEDDNDKFELNLSNCPLTVSNENIRHSYLEYRAVSKKQHDLICGSRHHQSV